MKTMAMHREIEGFHWLTASRRTSFESKRCGMEVCWRPENMTRIAKRIRLFNLITICYVWLEYLFNYN